ncbi:GMC family oxidoreductase [Erwinia sp. E602]|uniref:GMC family oxidoreductase n=1 Tax=Erwinia sp. E602 TaxID=2675378 RepID=UPI001BAD98D2|nr:GMC family oxidoreductase [Erwinia sp. E602]QUG76593.1 GMC family oxidoreductase [Erwinia sp. E602]
MSDITDPPVDVLIVGFGWTGSLMARELADSGLKILALERGEQRDTQPDFAYPRIMDELTYAVRLRLFQNPARETVTVRHSMTDRALPYRRFGSFLPGNGVGGAGVHWNGMLWRPLEADLQMRSMVSERYGAGVIPADMQLQDYPFSYQEMEPWFDKFEKICGAAGQAGNINGTKIAGGNPFEAPRAGPYPTRALKQQYAGTLFGQAAEGLGYSPFPVPAANCSEPWTNPYGVQLGVCNYCGYCERFGCFNASKASPQSAVLPSLRQFANFSLRTEAHVLRVVLDSAKKVAVGAEWIDSQGRTHFQPAALVVLSAFQLHNVRLLLLSKIGKTYDPLSGEGVVGRNYAYQINGGINLFFGQETCFNPFGATGCTGTFIDDFNAENFDHSGLGFIGGATISATITGGRPIQQMPLPHDTPRWGSAWKKGIQQHYLHTMSIGSSGSVMPYRHCYLDLDPTWRDVHGQPLLRMTFDWQQNELMMTRFIAARAAEIAEAIQPQRFESNFMDLHSHYDVRPYQSTHTTGGTVMGNDPRTSVVNRYLQCWDVHNLFVTGASVFPQNMAYNPTGLVGATALWAAHAIKTRYFQQPGSLV